MNDSVARTLIQILSSSITSLLMFLLFYNYISQNITIKQFILLHSFFQLYVLF